MKLKVQTLDAKAKGDIEVSEAVFGLEPRADILHRVVTWQREKASVSTWLHRIAHNLCIDYLRKDKSSLSTEYEDEHEGSDRPADAPEKTQQLAALQQALDALPERQRSAIVLSHYHGFSNKEIATIMDISVDALESILARARRSLKAQLKQ